MDDAARHPDLLTRSEAAALLGKDPGRGWGPRPLPAYKRPRYWSRQQCEEWLAEQRSAAWGSTETRAASTGTTASSSPGMRGGGLLARQIAAQLRSKSAGNAPTGNPRRLLAVPDEDEG